MGKTIAASRFGAVFVLVMALVFGCVCTAMPGKAHAANLTAGSYVVADVLDAPSISNAVSTGAGKLTVNVNSGYSDGIGFEYEASLNKAFTNAVRKTVAVSGSTSKTTIKGLKPGKKYFVRVRQLASYNNQTYCTPWSSPASAKVAIKNAKSKIMGVWKITGSNAAALSNIIKRNKRISSRAKATLTFKKNGIILLTDYDKSKTKLTSSWGKWVALSKTKGQTIVSGFKLANITVKSKGKKLTLNAGGKKIYCARL